MGRISKHEQLHFCGSDWWSPDDCICDKAYAKHLNHLVDIHMESVDRKDEDVKSKHF